MRPGLGDNWTFPERVRECCQICEIKPKKLEEVVDSFHCCAHRAEKVAEITSWLKSHPVSSVSRTSCELQVLDGTIVEKIEEAVEKVTHKHTSALHSRRHKAPFCLN